MLGNTRFGRGHWPMLCGPRLRLNIRLFLLLISSCLGMELSSTFGIFERQLSAQEAPRATRVGAANSSIPTTYFLGVGIDRYKDEHAWSTLSGAVNDLAIMTTTLTESYNVVIRDTLTNERATAEAMRTMIDAFLNDPESDSLSNAILYFAGHGTSISRRNGEPRTFLIPHDGAAEPSPGDPKGIAIRRRIANDLRYAWSPEQRWIPVDALLDDLRERWDNAEGRLRQVLVIVDACLIGSEAAGEFSDNAAKDAYSERYPARELMTAAGPNRLAIERDEQGVFTGNLARALNSLVTSSQDTLVRSIDVFIATQKAMQSLGEASVPTLRYFTHPEDATGSMRSRFTFWVRTTDDLKRRQESHAATEILTKHFDTAMLEYRCPVDRDQLPPLANLRNVLLDRSALGQDIVLANSLRLWRVDFECGVPVPSAHHLECAAREYDKTRDTPLIPPGYWSVLEARHEKEEFRCVDNY